MKTFPIDRASHIASLMKKINETKAKNGYTVTEIDCDQLFNLNENAGK